MRIAIFPYSYLLGEVTACLQVGKALRSLGVEVIFFSHGGDYEYLIQEENFPLYKVKPYFTPQDHQRIMRLQREEEVSPPFTVEKLLSLVEGEKQILEKVRPEGVLMGFNIVSPLSCRLKKVPLISLLSGTWTAPYFEKRRATWKKEKHPLLSLFLPPFLKSFLINRLLLRSKFLVSFFNQAARILGISVFLSLLDYLSGDLVLVADLPELLGISPEYMENYLPRKRIFSKPVIYRYTGPIYAKLKMSVPEEVEKFLSTPGWKIYCSMGSSTPVQILEEAIQSLKLSGYLSLVVIPPHLRGKINPPSEDKILFLSLIPAHKINPLCDLALIHGGRGTVYTACASGTPIIGVGMQMEQRFNLDCIRRLGLGISLSKKVFKRETVVGYLKYVFRNYEKFKRNALKIQRRIKNWEGERKAAQEIVKFLKGR